MNWAGDVAWLIECLLATHKTLGLVPSTTTPHTLGVVARTLILEL